MAVPATPVEAIANGSTAGNVVRIYQDAGAVGLAMISLVIIILILAILLFRILKMYSELSGAKDVNEALRMQTYSALASEVLEMRKDIKDLSSTISKFDEKDQPAKNSAKLDKIIGLLSTPRKPRSKPGA